MYDNGQAGAWAARWGRRRPIMIAAALGRAALLASVPVAYALGALSFGGAASA